MPDYVLKAMEILKKNGFVGFAVGGCVRDSLLGKTPDDYDMTVSCFPEETEKCFEDFRCIETGIQHGTVTVLLDGHMLELTTFRRDGEYKDNRHPEGVTFTRDISNDLSRRDFTVNAMAYSPDTGLVDLFGGRDDLKNGIIRCVGDPVKRFEEDALRIMRCVRFASSLEFKTEKATAEAAFDCSPLLQNISAERIFTELKKLLNGKAAKDVLLKYRKILETAVPELQAVSDADYLSAADKITAINGTESKLTLFLSPLGTQKADEALCGLKCDNRQRKLTSFLLENAQREFSSVGEVKRFAGEHGTQKLKMLLSYREALGQTDDELLRNGINAAEDKNACLKITDLALNGADIAAMGYKGKEIGEILSRLLLAVTEEKTENEKEKLKKYINTV